MRRTRAPRIYLTRLSDPPPPEATRGERFYYEKQIESQAPLAVSLVGGERLEGRLISHDEATLGFTLTEGRELLLDKREVRYLHKRTAPSSRPQHRKRTA